jgi:hypothetical protein
MLLYTHLKEPDITLSPTPLIVIKLQGGGPLRRENEKGVKSLLYGVGNIM